MNPSPQSISSPSLGPSNNTVDSAWIGDLLSDSKDVVQDLLSEPLQDARALRRQVESYLARIQRASAPLADLGQARALSAATIELLERTRCASEEQRRLAQVAARYFVLEHDGADDLTSPYGFDDDVEVYNAVVCALGYPHEALPY